MEPTFITPDIRMADLTRAIQKLTTLWPNVTAEDIKNKYKINYELLRFEIMLKPNQSLYEINPVEGNDTLKNLERKIASGHSFIATSAGLGVHKVDFASASSTTSNEGTYPLFFSPDPAQFVGTLAGSVPEYRALLNIWNGKLSIHKDSDQVVRVPLINGLKTALGNYNATAPITLPELSPDLEKSGVLQRLYTQILIDGGATNRIKIELPVGDTLIIDGSRDAAGSAVNTSRNVLSVFIGGFYIENKSDSAGAPCRL